MYSNYELHKHRIYQFTEGTDCSKSHFSCLFWIFLQNQKLLLENQLLREKTHGLVIENQELRTRLGMDALASEEAPETESKVNLRTVVM